MASQGPQSHLLDPTTWAPGTFTSEPTSSCKHIFLGSHPALYCKGAAFLGQFTVTPQELSHHICVDTSALSHLM